MGSVPRPVIPLSAEALAAILDHLRDAVVVLAADGTVRYANTATSGCLGRPAGDLLGEELWAIFPESVGRAFHLAAEETRRRATTSTLAQFDAVLGRWLEATILPHDGELLVSFRDVTERRRVEDELREYGERMTEAERIAHFGVWKWEVATGRVLWSEELHRIYGLEPGGFEGTVDGFVGRLHPADRERVWEHIGRAMETLLPFSFEERVVRPDGEVRLLLSRGRVLTGPDGEAAALVGVCHDITDRRAAEDALGATQRRMRAIVDHTPSMVAVKDLDGRYLAANAETGRVFGVPAEDLVGRYCSEFLPHDVSERVRADERAAAAEGEPVFGEIVLDRDGEHRTFLTVTFPLPDADGVPIETCTVATDVTEARERESQRRERRTWEERIGRALAEDRIVAYVQPVVDLMTGRPAAVELLARMRAADGTILTPAAFLPAAERYGLVQAIDIDMVRRAIDLAPRTRSEVNLSAVTLSDPAAREELVGLLAAAPEAARRIVFEITETAAVEHLEAACAFAADLDALGGGLALDDFGTGFGSFTYLRRLPLRYLKIDRSFVADLAGSRDDRRVVESIVGIAAQFGLQTIAEGVEDAETLDLVRRLGADFAQGYHLGRPAPVGVC